VSIDDGKVKSHIRYGCTGYRYRGTCTNRLTIRQDRLETQLLRALEAKIADSDLIEHTIVVFHRQLDARLRELQSNAGVIEELRRERQEQRAQADRVADAIAAAGHSAILLARLETIEAQITSIDERIAATQPVDLSATIGSVRTFVTRSLGNLREILCADAANAKPALAKLLGPLTLTPRETNDGPVYDVTGGIDLRPQVGKRL
jgi:hypothetical protein